MGKISALPTDTAPDPADVVPFVDVSAGRTEAVTVGNLAVSSAFAGQYQKVFTPEAYGALGDGTTDDSAALIACIAACQAADGGVISFGPKTYRINSQIVIPNDAAASYPRQKSMRWVGAGAYSDPRGGGGPYPDLTDIGGTILDLRYTGGGSNLAKIDTRGKGVLEATNITFADLGTSSNPFIKTTNTTLHFRGNAFVGNTAKAGSTCDQDAIILGGTDNGAGGETGPNAPFQGYGTIIEGNHFARIRRAVLFQNFANACVFRQNNIWISCGSNLANGAAIEMLPLAASGFVFGNVIEGNLIEAGNYVYPIKADYAQGNSFIANNFYDPNVATTLGMIRFDSVNATSNLVVCGYAATSVRHVSGAVAGINNIIDGNAVSGTYPAASEFVSGVLYYRGLSSGVEATQGAGNPAIILSAGSSTTPGIYTINTGPPSFAAPTGSICVVRANSGDSGKTLYVKDYGTSTGGWFPVGNMAPRQVRTKTGSYGLFDDDVVIFNGSSITATLPTAVGDTGRIYTVKNIHSTDLTIATTSAQTVDGAAPTVLAQWGVRRFMSNGSNWLTV